VSKLLESKFKTSILLVTFLLFLIILINHLSRRGEVPQEDIHPLPLVKRQPMVRHLPPEVQRAPPVVDHKSVFGTLDSYIRQGLAKGYRKGQLKQRLMAQGWLEDVVEEFMKRY
jgi:hypothetical protein